MAKLTITDVLQGLLAAGISARRGMPGEKLCEISESVAAVSLKQADMRKKTMTVLVTVFSPADLGAEACEEKAMQVGQVLTGLGGKCSVGSCRFDGRLALFFTEVTGEFATEIPKITIDNLMLTHVLAFTSWRNVDDIVTSWSDTKWNFRLEEYFPMGEGEEVDPVGAFTLVHTSHNGTETYSNATWTYQRRVWDASGVTQIRLGVAEAMETG